MPAPRFAPSDWSKARQAFIRLLETDPILKASGCRVVQLDGRTAKEFQTEPTEAQCPRIKVWCAGSPSGWETEGQHATPLEIEVEIASLGLDESAFLDLWGAIVRAVYPDLPGSPGRLAKERLMLDARIGQITMSRVPATEWSQGGPAILSGTGSFTLFIYVSTKE